MRQKDIIILHLQDCNTWKPSYSLRGTATKYGFIGNQGDRRCRELANEGKLQHKIEGGFAWYRAVPLVYRQYKVLNFDGEVEKTIQLAVK